ncbi:MAG: hypothetical protein IPG81_33915 [Sandaracinaceae bacterium]|nr:hypothetical protein [Sandaracinaceae bacterium]
MWARAARGVMALALGLGLFGCSARAPSEATSPAAASTGGERETASEVVYSEEAPGAGYSADGVSGEAEPSVAPDDAESMDAADAYEALRSVSADYDALMDRSSADCPEAERLVQRICYLAERVCGLEGVDRPDPNDTDGPARCDEARARCASSEARLERACS